MPPMTKKHHAATPSDIDRRSALKLLSGGVALSLASCGKPYEEIVPYVEQPERVVPGVPLRFATTLDLTGYGRGVIVTSMEGRPIKIEGNPRHPASLGATDVFAEAEIMSLYDPDRSKAPRGATLVETWEGFQSALRTQMEKEASRGGAGLAHSERPHHLADTRPPARRADQAISAGALVPLRADQRRFRNRRRAAFVRSPADPPAALFASRGRAGT